MNAQLALLTLIVAAAAPSPAPAPAPAAGLIGWMDERTARPVVAPAEALAALPDWELEQALRTDGGDLAVEADADGALTVRLDGRFQSALWGRVEADGRVVVEHAPADPASHSHP